MTLSKYTKYTVFVFLIKEIYLPVPKQHIDSFKGIKETAIHLLYARLVTAGYKISVSEKYCFF